MALRYDLSQSTFCAERWDDLDGDGSVRMCASCGHAVRDFRGASDTEILRAHAETGRTCGVYTRRQLVQGGGATPRAPRSPVRQLAAWGTALAALGLANGARAQTPPAPTFTAATADLTLPQSDSTATDSVFVTGRVLDADAGEGLPGANVVATTADGQMVGVAADVDGVFRLDVTPLRDGGAATATVRVAYVGYDVHEFEINLLQSSEVTPRLCSDLSDLTGIVVVGYDSEPWSLWGWIRRTLRF